VYNQEKTHIYSIVSENMSIQVPRKFQVLEVDTSNAVSSFYLGTIEVHVNSVKFNIYKKLYL